jgi:gliding motility-associated-like protein
MVAAPASSTAYMVVVTGNNGCTDTAHITVNVVEKPEADAGLDKTIIAGNAVQLSASVSGQDVTFLWSPADYLSNSDILQPVANPPSDIDYILTATSNAGCGVDIDTMHVFVFNDIYIPNAFSPDNNRVNDTWNIPALNAFPNFELFIYNRRGQLIYQSKNILKPWDGTYKGEPQPAGAYVYVIDVKEKRRPLYKGTLMLIR